MIELYKNIKRLREEKGLSQEELAKMTGYTNRSSVAKIEKGEVDLQRSKIIAFAKALNVRPGELMGWNNDPEPPAPAESTASLSASESELVDKFRQLNDDGQEKLLDYAEDLAGLPRYKKDNLFEALEEEA